MDRDDLWTKIEKEVIELRKPQAKPIPKVKSTIDKTEGKENDNEESKSDSIKEKSENEGENKPIGENNNVDSHDDDEEEEKPNLVIPPSKGIETFALFVGDGNSGKSTLISNFLNPSKDDKLKPTTALEYTFARKNNQNNVKDIAHIWELGGGISDLVKIPLTPIRLLNMVFIITIDLSKPENTVQSLTHWITVLKKALNDCMEKKPALKQKLYERSKKKYGKNHPDINIVDPFTVPVLIVCTKYDDFKKLNGVHRKGCTHALRFFAHQHGAAILYCSMKEKTLKDQFRGILNHLFFRSGVKKTQETNGEKAIVIPAGTDSFDSILKVLPKGTEPKDFVTANHVQVTAIETWSSVMEAYFGETTFSAKMNSNNNGRNNYNEDIMNNENQYPEAIVDEARALRDQILIKYRKETARKERNEMQMKMNIDSEKRSKSKSSSRSEKSSKREQKDDGNGERRRRK